MAAALMTRIGGRQTTERAQNEDIGIHLKPPSVAADTYWSDAARFIERYRWTKETIVAPREFEYFLGEIIDYDMMSNHIAPDIFVIHKDMIEFIGRDTIEDLCERMYPSFANEVFVIYTGQNAASKKLKKSDHFLSFKSLLKSAVTNIAAQNVSYDHSNRSMVYLGNNTALTRTKYGHKIYVDTRDLSLAPHILMDGCWENWITDVFRRSVQPGMNVIDIGANIGWYSLIAADLIGESGKLVSFEANPSMAEMTRRNLMINGYNDRSKVESKAVFDKKTTLGFKIYDRYMGSSSLFASQEAAAAFGDTITTLDVQTVVLDEYVKAGEQLDFVKIDAEGAEPFILRGGERVIGESKNIQIMMEFAPSMLSNSFGSIDQFYDEIEKHGFRVWRIHADASLKVTNLEELKCVDHCDVILKR